MSRIQRVRTLLLLAALAAPTAAQAYDLKPQRVADGVYVVLGEQAHFTRENGGDIANTAFLATSAGAVVIDTGPSAGYGKALRQQIRKTLGSDRIAALYLTHAHPDHVLGSQAFDQAPLWATAETTRQLRTQGSALTDNLYRLVGRAMAGTILRVPDRLAAPGVVQHGDRTLDLLVLAGHSASDLAVFDRSSGTLFAGDLVFFERTPTTPSADLPLWLGALERLRQLPFRQLVPGHGPVVSDARSIEQTRDYLEWLRATLESAARQGADMPELLTLAPPERFSRLAVFQEELERSVIHLYPDIEQEWLRPVGGPVR